MMLSIKDVALRLNLPIETVLRWVRQGKIPMQSIRGEYVIRLAMLERWAKDHKLDVRTPAATVTSDVEPDFDGILPAMERGGIFYDVGGDQREAALRSAVELVPNIDASDYDLVFQTLLERETLASTGIGHGIALPHPRSNPGLALDRPQITTCFLNHPVDCEAVDGRPVSVLMILLSRSTRQHVTMLSKLSFHLRDAGFRKLLLSRPAQEDILNAISDMEA
jgi:PTS system nitrogen regulatory IIA component